MLLLHELGFQLDLLDPANKSQPSNCTIIDPSCVLGFGGKVSYGELRIARVELGLGMDLGEFSGIGEWDWWYF